MTDLSKLIGNLGEKERQTLIEMALSMAKNRQDGWTGVTVWYWHTTQGAIGEAVEEKKRSLFNGRRVRSKGVV